MATLEAIGEFPGSRVFIAGAGGTIGNIFCPLLWGAWHVTASTNSSARVRDIEAQGVNAVVVDAMDAEALRNVVAAARPTIVVNLLSDQCLTDERDSRVGEQNLEIGTRNLIAAASAARATRFVAHSSATQYATGSMPYNENALFRDAAEVERLERQVVEAPFDSVILRLGHLFGPGTNSDTPPALPSLHVEAAAEATRRALFSGGGVYNLADDGGAVDCQRAKIELDWRSNFRAGPAKEAARMADSIWRLATKNEPVPDLSQVKAYVQKNLERRETKLLFDKLFDQCWCMTWGGNELEGAEDTLKSLEEMLVTFPLASCVLLSRLFGRVYRVKTRYDNDSDTAKAALRTAEYICDSVIVSVLKNKSPELKEQLQLLANDTPFEELKNRYRKWAQTM